MFVTQKIFPSDKLRKTRKSQQAKFFKRQFNFIHTIQLKTELNCDSIRWKLAQCDSFIH